MNRVDNSWLLCVISITAISCSKQKPQQTTPAVATAEAEAATEGDRGAAIQGAAAGDGAVTEEPVATSQPVPTEAVDAQPAVVEAVSLPEPLPPPQPKLSKFFVGTKGFGVNRVNDGKRSGSATIADSDDGLMLSAELTTGEFHLKLSGTVHPISRREFILDGEMTGTPDLSFRSEPATERTTTGRFLFKATGKRRFWRMYQVNGTDCVCNDGCGNEFCYIDISFGNPTKR